MNLSSYGREEIAWTTYLSTMSAGIFTSATSRQVCDDGSGSLGSFGDGDAGMALPATTMVARYGVDRRGNPHCLK